MNLQHALDTLRLRLLELLEERGRYLANGQHHQYVTATGEMFGIEYAMDVLEAALGDSK